MEIVTILTASNHKYVEMLRQLREYMKAKKLPENTQKRLLNYYEFRFQKCYFKESEIFNVISSQLKQVEDDDDDMSLRIPLLMSYTLPATSS